MAIPRDHPNNKESPRSVLEADAEKWRSPLQQVGLHRKGDGKFFAFIPRQWPYLWEKLIKPAGQQPGSPSSFPELLRDTLIHQDIVTYCRGLSAKLRYRP